MIVIANTEAAVLATDLLRRALAQHADDPGRVAVVDAESQITYAELATSATTASGDTRVVRATGRVADVRDVVHAALSCAATLLVDAGATQWERQRVDREFARARSRVTPGDPALFLCTSGSSGLPAVVPIAWAGCLDNALAFAEAAGISAGDRIWCTTPLHHRFCFAGGILAGLLVGATIVLKPGTVGPQELRDVLLGDRVTTVLSVPFLFRRYADGLERDPDLLSRWQVRTCIAAGETVPDDLMVRWSAVTGAPLLPHYGSTEDGQISIGRGEIGEGVGRPLTDTEVTSDSDDQLLVRRVGTDPWRATGDRGHVDANGNVHVTGRIGDRLNVAGKKVDPVEVESALRLHPEVRDAAVVAVTGGASGPEIVAFVVANAAVPDLRAVRRHAAALLSPYKVPRRLLLVDELPRTRTGKLRRGALIEAAQAG